MEFTFLMITIGMVAVSTQNIDVFAQTNDEKLDTDSFEWTILLGDDLKNNPTAIKILKNISEKDLETTRKTLKKITENAESHLIKKGAKIPKSLLPPKVQK